ncbi:MAG: Nif11 family protein [Prochlorococcaceae cyanobacterium]
MDQSTLQAFVAHLPQMPDVQRLLADSRSPDQILALARDCGFCFSLEELRKASCSLAADHWPWGGKGSEVRIAFFGQEALQVENSS